MKEQGPIKPIEEIGGTVAVPEGEMNEDTPIIIAPVDEAGNDVDLMTEGEMNEDTPIIIAPVDEAGNDVDLMTEQVVNGEIPENDDCDVNEEIIEEIIEDNHGVIEYNEEEEPDFFIEIKPIEFLE